MITPPRAPVRLLAVSLLSALALTGCGVTGGRTTAPTPATGTPSFSYLPTPTPTPTPEATDEPTAVPTGHSTPSSPDAQVVEVTKYGISFELPKGWITLNARKVFREGGARNPVIKELADKLGMSPDQLIRAFSSTLQTMSVTDEGAHDGFLDNVNSIGEAGEVNEDQFKLGLATVGAKPGAFEHATSPAGDVLRVPYTLESKSIGRVLHAVAVVVVGGGQTVTMTVSASSAARAAKIADQIQASLKKIPGGGSNL
jgi:hypothetical protein